MHPYQAYHPDLPLLLQRLQSVQIELKDVAEEVGHISDHINYDPEKIEQLNERLSLGYKLLKKHGVQTTVNCLQIQKQLKEKLQAVLNIDEAIQEKEKQSDLLLNEATDLAKKISVIRNKQVKPLEDQ